LFHYSAGETTLRNLGLGEQRAKGAGTNLFRRHCFSASYLVPRARIYSNDWGHYRKSESAQNALYTYKQNFHLANGVRRAAQHAARAPRKKRKCLRIRGDAVNVDYYYCFACCHIASEAARLRNRILHPLGATNQRCRRV